MQNAARLLPGTLCLLALAQPASAAAGPDLVELAPSTGLVDARLAPFDGLMTRFVADNQAPGAALAVVKDGRLVYARGFGWADAEARQPVQPTSLFRIASVSKPFTAAAVLHLVDEGKLRLDDRAFEVLGYEPFLEAGGHVDPRLRDVTIRHLLQHTGGWDRDQSFDPMFRSVAIARAMGSTPPASPQQIVRYMMGRPLDFDPGSRYAYSNFGYCVLGRVIEKVSGQSYEQYVRKEILAPLGIRDMRLGRTLAEGRAEGEVRYDGHGRTGRSVFGPKLGQQVPLPYGAWCIEAMDAHGGWIGSAVDLVRFAAAFDDAAHCPVLSARSVRAMFARPEGLAGYESDGRPRAAYYGCGWSVRPVARGAAAARGRSPAGANTWHLGALDGTASLLVRRSDGLAWAVLFNTRTSADGKQLGDAIDPLLHRAADAVETWPEKDLFPRYFGQSGGRQ